MKRYLITSADVRTWKYDRPAIFLGEFCRPYEKTHIWSRMDAIVAEPYGISLEDRNNDYKFVRSLRESLIEDVFPVLNNVHKVNYDKKLWLILLGDWINRYVDAIYNRVKTLEQCLNNYEISEISIVSTNEYEFARKNSISATLSFNEDNWNDLIFSLIVQKKYSHLKIDKFHISGCNEISSPSNEIKILRIKDYIKCFLSLINQLLFKIFGRESDAFIISSYLPRISEIKLQLALGQIPVLWGLRHHNRVKLNSKYDPNQRKHLNLQMSKENTDSNIQNILKEFFYKIIPVAYLEGFEELNNLVNKLPWPKKPKFIYTSNNYDHDDVFKLYVVKKSFEYDVKYCVGCHGHGYFNYWDNPSNVEMVCDKFITWGWDHGLPQNEIGFVFTTVNKKREHCNHGKLLLIEYPLMTRCHTWDVYGAHSNYFQKQVQFVSLLKDEPKSNLIIRLHGTNKIMGWGELEKWKSIDSKLNVDCGVQKLENLIAKSRLLVFGYDSTGFAEAMSLNIPALMFFQVGFDQLNPLSKPYYSILMDEGITHDTPETMSKKVNEVWDDVDAWWAQCAIQEARKQFCQQYARTSQSPVRELKQILLR